MTLLLHPALGEVGGPRDWSGAREGVGGFGRPGGDLLFRALRRSTIGAEGFHGRVRDGIGCYAPRYGHQAVQSRRERPRAPTYTGGRAAARTAPRRKPGPILRRPRPAEASCVVSSEGKGLPPSGFRRNKGSACRRGGTRVPPGMILAAGRGRGKPIERLVPVSCAGCPASTSGLST